MTKFESMSSLENNLLLLVALLFGDWIVMQNLRTDGNAPHEQFAKIMAGIRPSVESHLCRVLTAF